MVSIRELQYDHAAAYDAVRHVIPEVEWAMYADDIEAIQRLKREQDAVILAHNYMTPEVFHGVSDIKGDSLALAREAQHVDAGTIVLSGVHFMAETAKLLNPSKRVLLPDLRSGCSLAESITPEDIAQLRREHPGAPVVTSTPAVWPSSGWPGVLEPQVRSALRSSSSRPKPPRKSCV